MTTVAEHQKKVSLKIETPLYSLLERQAMENGEGLNDLICRLLSEAVDDWRDYCATVQCTFGNRLLYFRFFLA